MSLEKQKKAQENVKKSPASNAWAMFKNGLFLQLFKSYKTE